MNEHSEILRKQLTELEAQCDQVLQDIASIKEQLGRAKAKAQADRVYSDSDWYQSANRALRHKQIEHQRVLRAAADLRRQIAAARQPADDPRGRTFERQFMIEAKALLSETTYREVIARTQRATGKHT
jgi:phage shock protein A